MGNAVPNSARDDPNDVDLSPAQADNLLRYQLSQPHPRYLAPNAFYIASITGSEPLSRSVHKALVKAKIVLPAPKEEDGTETMTVNTAGIGRGFASQLAVISVHAQRKLVGLLFFWEEECTRWKLLDEEEAEIRALLDSEGEEMRSNVDLNCALEAVEMKKVWVFPFSDERDLLHSWALLIQCRGCCRAAGRRRRRMWVQAWVRQRSCLVTWEEVEELLLGRTEAKRRRESI